MTNDTEPTVTIEGESVDSDFRTSDNTLIFNGTAEAGSEVELFVDDESIGTTTADAQGEWSYDYTDFEFADGEYELTATAKNPEGAVGNTPDSTPLLEVDTDYDIEIDVSSIDDPEIVKKINSAKEYWERIILNDIPDKNNPEIGGFVDDVEIVFKVAPLQKNDGTPDGEGNTLAEVTDLRLRNPDTSGGTDPLTGQPLSSFDALPLTAVITIDVADLGSPQLEQTLRHEIAHAIGFNAQTINDRGLVRTFEQNGITYYGFTGSNALATYKELGGEDSHESVPLENKSFPGHWNELLFPDSSEINNFDRLVVKYLRNGNSDFDGLMTTSNPGETAVLSALTLGAMDDLGFQVDYTQASDIRVYPGSIGIPGAVQGDAFFGTNQLFDIQY